MIGYQYIRAEDLEEYRRFCIHHSRAFGRELPAELWHYTDANGLIGILKTLANLFLHYAFDAWMSRNYPHIPFERYADDAICHCKIAEEARALWSLCGLQAGAASREDENRLLQGCLPLCWRRCKWLETGDKLEEGRTVPSRVLPYLDLDLRTYDGERTLEELIDDLVLEATSASALPGMQIEKYQDYLNLVCE
jgi:hypothetical protein